MQRNTFQKREKRRFFAVTSLGKDRWYWVVWPSVAEVQRAADGRHLEDGYEEQKADAVDRALEVAGVDGERLAAKYAKDYHRQLRQAKEGQAASAAMPLQLEFLYQDVRDGDSGEWRSVAHRVVKKTKKYVYVERQPYDESARTGTWLDAAGPVIRLSRQLLEAEGYTLAPVMEIDDPLFFTTPYPERATQPLTCFVHLGLTYPCTEAEVKTAYRRLAKQHHPDQGGDHDEFLKLQAAYEQALRVVRT